MVALALSVQVLFAQHPISVALTRLLNTGDFREAQEAISNYSISELAALPDSTLFDYYYLKAAISGNKANETDKRAYLLEAKKLCEKAQGIHSPVYLELCWAIGNSFEAAGDTLSAFEIYQAALIQSIGLYTLDDEERFKHKAIGFFAGSKQFNEYITEHNNNPDFDYILKDITVFIFNEKSIDESGVVTYEIEKE